ncbi:MAG: Asp/Glu/hydantoin racemase [Mesorhizobium sp.]|nr:aspartate/glutamate racemase family protein [Mesorhizobium sp.]RWM08233.1 MAG: Asp/Glu/hydantoin racemase [Mesorhizobium sp.]
MPLAKSPSTGTLAMIHTVPGLIPVLEPLARQNLPCWATFNMLDESLLRITIREGGLSAATMRRLTCMVWSAVDAGADAVVVTCSSLGPAIEAARLLCPVLLFRIDEGMAIEAIGTGRRIGVLATLRTTLDPTTNLIRCTAARLGHDCAITSVLSEGAFERLSQGDAEGHDRMVAQSLRDLAPQVDVILLAQASMARVLPSVREAMGTLPVLTSPEIGMRHLRKALTA